MGRAVLFLSFSRSELQLAKLVPLFSFLLTKFQKINIERVWQGKKCGDLALTAPGEVSVWVPNWEGSALQALDPGGTPSPPTQTSEIPEQSPQIHNNSIAYITTRALVLTTPGEELPKLPQ